MILSKEQLEIVKRLTQERDEALSILKRSAKWIPHTPQSYKPQMGGAGNGPCTEGCPACAVDKIFIQEKDVK